MVLRSPIHANEPSEYNGMLYRTSNRVLNNGIKVIILICMDGTSQYHHHQDIFVQEGSSGTRFDNGHFEIKTLFTPHPNVQYKQMKVRKSLMNYLPSSGNGGVDELPAIITRWGCRCTTCCQLQ